MNSGSMRDVRIAMMMATHACARQGQRETRGKNDRARRRRKLEPLSFLRAVQLLRRWGTTTRFSPLFSLLSSSSSFRRLALLASTESSFLQSFPYSDDPLLLVTRLLNRFRLGEIARKRHRGRNLNGSLFRVLYKF